MLGVLFGAAILLSLAHLPFAYGRVSARRGTAYRLLLMLLILVGGAEVLVRVVNPLGISYYQWARQYILDRLPDDGLLFRHRPNFSATYGGTFYSFNEYGFRDRPIHPKEEGEYRIMALGDSVTMASGVPVEHGYVRQLEERLAERISRPVRIVNTGVGGYNTDQQRVTLDRFADRLQPDLVTLLYVENDIEINHRMDPSAIDSISGRSPPEVVKYLLGRTWTYRLAKHLARHGAGRAPPPPNRDDPGFRASMESLRAIARACHTRAIPFVVFVWGLWETPRRAALFERVVQVGTEERFEVCDVLPWFERADLREVRISAVDSHPTREGHRILARGMDAFLADLGLPDGEEKGE
jgi:lysophospholipase L1-like esterase